MIVIQTIDLVKKYRDLTAVDHLNLTINQKECFGLLGPNGAGKTTLIRMITAVSPPTSGKIFVAGKELQKYPRQLKAIMGIVPQMDNLDPDLTVLQNLTTFARYYDIPADQARQRSIEVLELFELQGKMNSQIKELSGGMKRRLLIARGLINQPEIVILDEPTVGLDPQSRHMVWNKLTELKSRGVTQLLCTQNMDEAAVLCDRVAIMFHGRILNTDTPQNLIDRYVGKEVWEISINAPDNARFIDELQRRGVDYEHVDSKIHVFHVDSDSFAQEVLNYQGDIRRRPTTLEDVFFKLTGRSLVE